MEIQVPRFFRILGDDRTSLQGNLFSYYSWDGSMLTTMWGYGERSGIFNSSKTNTGYVVRGSLEFARHFFHFTFVRLSNDTFGPIDPQL